jgi:hypothetical protein
MNTRRQALKILAVLILLLNNSCIDHYSVSTKINADGSLERTIQVVCDDSASVFKGNLKIPTDTSWTISTLWFYSTPGDSTSEKKFEYTATKHFQNVVALNNYLKVENDTSTQIKTESSFSKKFRWFYTYISYKETYRKSLPFEYYKPKDFINENELSYFYDDDYTYVKEKDSLVHIKDLDKIPLLSHQDSLKMDKLEYKIIHKLSDFLGRNIYEEYYQYLVSELKTDKTKFNYLVENKDSIYKHSRLSDAFTDLNLDDKDPFELIAEKIGLTSDSIEKLNPQAFKAVKTKIDNSINLFVADEELINTISMPGLLLKTNADSIREAQAYWNYSEHYFYLNDYKLYAESRIVNKWAFAVTGIAIIFLVMFVFFGRRKQ